MLADGSLTRNAFTCVRSLPTATSPPCSAPSQLGLHTLIAKRQPRDLVLALIDARVIDAQSKLATARALAPDSAVSTLGEVRARAVDQHELYAAHGLARAATGGHRAASGQAAPATLVTT